MGNVLDMAIRLVVDDVGDGLPVKAVHLGNLLDDVARLVLGPDIQDCLSMEQSRHELENSTPSRPCPYRGCVMRASRVCHGYMCNHPVHITVV